MKLLKKATLLAKKFGFDVPQLDVAAIIINEAPEGLPNLLRQLNFHGLISVDMGGIPITTLNG